MSDSEMELDATLGAAFDSAEDGQTVTDTPDIEPALEATETPADEQETTTPETTEGEPATAITAPVSWSAEDKARFAELPPDVQQVIARRESERDSLVSQRAEEAATLRKQNEAIEAAMAPHRDGFRAEGLDDATALNRMFQLWNFANEKPGEFINWFAGQRGVQPQNPEPVDEFTDPEITALRQQIEQQEQRWQQFEQQQVQSQRAEISQSIVGFAEKTDEGGNKLYPHFETVRATMGALMGSGGADSLEDAYQKAVWANPDTRSSLIEATKAKDLAAAKAAATKAEKASTQPRGEGGRFVPSTGSLDDTLAAAFDAASG